MSFHQQYDLEDSVNSSLIGVPQSLLRTLSRRLSLPALGMRKHHWAEPNACLDWNPFLVYATKNWRERDRERDEKINSGWFFIALLDDLSEVDFLSTFDRPQKKIHLDRHRGSSSAVASKLLWQTTCLALFGWGDGRLAPQTQICASNPAGG